MSYTQEQENYFKLVTLIYCFGANVNRDLFHRFLHSTNTTLEKFINDHQHEIYHFFCNVNCCLCTTKLMLPKQKVISQKQMLSIFENSQTDRLANHQSQKTGKLCCLKAKKSVDLKDLDFTLIRFFLLEFCYQIFWDCHLQNDKSFSAFLEENVHKVYHLYVDKIRCCMCNNDRDIPDRCIHQKQFEMICKQGRSPCLHPFCSCQYTIQSDLTLSSLVQQDTDLTTKLTKRFCSCRKYLDNIYEHRNKIAHHPDCSINNNTFWEIWNETKPKILEVAKALDKENEYKVDLQELIDGPTNKVLFITMVLNLLKRSEHVTVDTLQKIEDKANSIEDKIEAIYTLAEDIHIAKLNNMNSSECSGNDNVNSDLEISFEVKIQINSTSKQTAQGIEVENSDLDEPPDNFTCGKCKENFTKLKMFCKHKETCDTKQVNSAKHYSEIMGKFMISKASDRLETKATKMFQDNPDHFDTDEIDVRYVERGCLVVWTESSQYDLENKDKLKEDCIQFTKNMFQKCSLDSTETTNIKVNVKFSKTFEDSLETKDDDSDYLQCGTCQQEFFAINSFISHKKECIRNRKISKQNQEDISKLHQTSKEPPKNISRTESDSTNRYTSSQEMPDSILTKLIQLNRDDFKDLVALGTFASYENRVYLAGPYNIGKSSLASILIGEEIPNTWCSTDGRIIHFGRNGIDLLQRKMIPLKTGSGDVLEKLLSGHPQLINKDEVYDAPLSNLNKKEKESSIPIEINRDPSKQHHKSSSASKHTSSDGRPKIPPKPDRKIIKAFRKRPIYSANLIQDGILEKIKQGSYRMHIAPSDLVDFGGHIPFDMTHQLFIQQTGTFILMFDGRRGLDSKLDEYPQGNVTAASILKHWINSVLTYCEKRDDKMPRIMFAATHSDTFSKIEKEKLTKHFQEELTEMFSSHKLHEHIMYHKVFFINATDAADQNIDHLKDALVDIAFQQSTWGQRMPIVWVPLDLQIADMRVSGVQMITKKRLLEVNKSNKEFALSERTLEHFLLVQHSIGKLLYFDEPLLREFIVIQPSAMVNILKSFITDRMFWPEEESLRHILENLSSTGVLKKIDLFTLWSQPAFCNIITDERTKEYILQVLLHLDILIEPKRYTVNDTAAELFLVPCMAKETIPANIQKNATDDRTICIAYHLKETVIPPALAFKLIGASISIWPLKVVDNRFCLYFQAAILDADRENELQIHVEGQRIVAYLINAVSKDLISPDLATTVQECLTLALRRILQFYCQCFGKQKYQVTTDLFEIEVGEVCKGGICLLPLSDAKTETHWRCKNETTHLTKCSLNWVFDKKTKHCGPNCTGLKNETLLLKPNDYHFVQLASSMRPDDFYNFFMHLGMTKIEYDVLNFHYCLNYLDFKLMCLFEWRNKTELESTATFGKLLEALKAIKLEHYLCQVHREDYSLVEKAHIRLQDLPSDDVINSLTEQTLIGDCVVGLGVELGLSIDNIKEATFNHPRDLNGQIHALLTKWKKWSKPNSPKPTIYRLMVALKHIRAKEGLAFVMSTYGVK